MSTLHATGSMPIAFRDGYDSFPLGRSQSGTTTLFETVRYKYVNDGAGMDYDFSHNLWRFIRYHGSGFTYDADGIPTGGTYTSIEVVDWSEPLGRLASETFTTVAMLSGFAAPLTGYGLPGERARLLGGDDLITAAASSDAYVAAILTGEAGNDTLRSSPRGDRLDGGAGTDTADYSTATAAVTIALDGSLARTGDASYDILTGIEDLRGSPGNDHLRGDAGPNTVHGGGSVRDPGDPDSHEVLEGLGGSDVLVASGSNCRMYGGAGDDTYIGSEAFAVHEESSPAGGYDTVRTGLNRYQLPTGVERLYFTGAGNFIGLTNTLQNKLYGGAGHDVFVLDLWGQDQFQGYEGLDTIDLRHLAGAAINFLTNAHGGSAAGSVFSNIERVWGSVAAGDDITAGGRTVIFSGFGGNDILRGGGMADTLNGMDGSDTLAGHSGHDVLCGGGGNDTMTGGSGKDTFVFREAAFGADLIAGFEDGPDRLKFDDAVAASFAAFTLTGNTTASVVVALSAAPANSITLQSAGGAIHLTAADFLFF